MEDLTQRKMFVFLLLDIIKNPGNQYLTVIINLYNINHILIIY